MEQPPAISDALIDWLEEIQSEVCHPPVGTTDRLWWELGRRSVVLEIREEWRRQGGGRLSRVQGLIEGAPSSFASLDQMFPDE